MTKNLAALAAFLAGALALASQLAALLGYQPPHAVAALLHLTPDQIVMGLGILLAFTQRVDTLAVNAWGAVGDIKTLVLSIGRRDNEAADLAYAALLAQVAEMRAQVNALASAAPVPAAVTTGIAQAHAPTAMPDPGPVAQPIPVPQAHAGRVGLGAMLVTLAVSALCVLGACSTQQLATAQTDVQRAQEALQRVCPTLQASVTTLGMLDLAPQSAAALETAQGIINVACAADSTPKTETLQSLASAALPALDRVIEGSSMSADDKQKVVIDLGVVSAVLGGVLGAAPAPVAGPASGASGAI